MTALVCPGCGAAEAVRHQEDCTVRPFGARPCCGTLIYPDTEPAHRPWCQWADGRATDPLWRPE